MALLDVATGAGSGTKTSMPRPRKRRLLDRAPQAAIYKPAGVPLHGLRRVALLQEELEALLKEIPESNSAAGVGNLGELKVELRRLTDSFADAFYGAYNQAKRDGWLDGRYPTSARHRAQSVCAE